MKVALKDLSRVLRQDFRENRKIVDRGIKRAASRGRTLLVSETPVDTGEMKNAWRADDDSIHNDAPHAGIIERGARPHKVNQEGIESITRWAMGRLGVPEKEARSIAHGIAKKLERQGQEGKFIVEKNLPDLAKFVKKEIEREYFLRSSR